MIFAYVCRSSRHSVVCFFFLVIRRPPRSTRTDTLLPYTTLFRSMYLHVPFCRVRCGYCDFNTYTSTKLRGARSEEHTSELQSLMRISYAVLCLKKKIMPRSTTNTSFLLINSYMQITKHKYTTKTIRNHHVLITLA